MCSITEQGTTGYISVQGGSVEECLAKEHASFLSAALSVPLAVLHSILHDIAASLAFRAAAASAAALAAQENSAWRGALRNSNRVATLTRGLRVELWPSVTLLHNTAELKAESGTGPLGQQPAVATGDAAHHAKPCKAAIEVGIQDRQLTVCTDPNLHTLWEAAAVEQQAGVRAPSNPQLNLVSGDMDQVLMVRVLRTAHTANSTRFHGISTSTIAWHLFYSCALHEPQAALCCRQDFV